MELVRVALHADKRLRLISFRIIQRMRNVSNGGSEKRKSNEATVQQTCGGWMTLFRSGFKKNMVSVDSVYLDSNWGIFWNMRNVKFAYEYAYTKWEQICKVSGTILYPDIFLVSINCQNIRLIWKWHENYIYHNQIQMIVIELGIIFAKEI